ncbi:hypothetical protein [Gordonia terrae]
MTLLVLAGPSGVGKTAVGRELIRIRPSVRWIRSYTTRVPRLIDHEDPGRIFVSDVEFDALVAEEVAIWVNGHFGSRYATSRDDIERAEESSATYVLDYSPQDLWRFDLLAIEPIIVLLLPSSERDLRSRLKVGDREDRAAAAIESFHFGEGLLESGWLDAGRHYVATNVDSTDTAIWIASTILEEFS